MKSPKNNLLISIRNRNREDILREATNVVVNNEKQNLTEEEEKNTTTARECGKRVRNGKMAWMRQKCIHLNASTLLDKCQDEIGTA